VDFVSGEGWLAKEKQAVWLMLSRNNVSLPVTSGPKMIPSDYVFSAFSAWGHAIIAVDL